MQFLFTNVESADLFPFFIARAGNFTGKILEPRYQQKAARKMHALKSATV